VKLLTIEMEIEWSLKVLKCIPFVHWWCTNEYKMYLWGRFRVRLVVRAHYLRIRIWGASILLFHYTVPYKKGSHPLFGPFSFLGITWNAVEISCFLVSTFIPNMIPLKRTKFSVLKNQNSIFCEFFQFFSWM